MNKFSKIYNKIFDYTLIKTTPLKFANIITIPNKITINNMIKISTSHLYREMPIRFAHRIYDLNMFPYGLNHNHNVTIIRDWYLTSFDELISIPEPKTQTEIEEFKFKIENIYHRHSPTILKLTKGLFELKQSGLISESNDKQIQLFLDKFHTSRTEIRILIEHYLNMFESNNNMSKQNEQEHFGIINLKTDIRPIINKAISNINLICSRTIEPLDLDNIIKINGNAKLPIIENYLYYVLFEIIKNSTQAIITTTNQDKFIEIDIIDLNDYIYLKIKDNGIGIPEENIDKIWLYSYSTNPIEPKKIIELDDFDFSTESPLSGFGYGLPISKIYLNFFSSLIQIDSKYKQGTQVNIFLKKFN